MTSQPLMTSGGLADSAAYRNMLTSTQSTVKSQLSYVESDEEEDIEEILSAPPKKPE